MDKFEIGIKTYDYLSMYVLKYEKQAREDENLQELCEEVVTILKFAKYLENENKIGD